jgi:polyisoprenoid-binding protein YceI
MGLYHVEGRCRHGQGRIELPPDGEPHAEATIATGSVYTRIPPRDMHLRSRQFLDVNPHPEIHFRTGARTLLAAAATGSTAR